MSEKIYSRAPITEAVLELRLVRPVPVTDLKPIAMALQDSFPKVADFHQFSASLQAGKANLTQEHLGFELKSEDEKIWCRVLVTGITFIQLSPYRDWWYFEARAREVIGAFLRGIPGPFSRLGLRYINQFDLPKDVHPGEFLTELPQVAETWPTVVAGFNNEVQLLDDSIPSIVTIRQALRPSTTPENHLLIFDSDIGVENPPAHDDGALLGVLHQMRDMKNRLFEGVITDRTREMIQ